MIPYTMSIPILLKEQLARAYIGVQTGSEKQASQGTVLHNHEVSIQESYNLYGTWDPAWRFVATLLWR